MATKRRKSRKSCKHGKLKRSVRTKKGGRRKCRKKSKRKKIKSKRKKIKSKRKKRKKIKSKRKKRKYKMMENDDLIKIKDGNSFIRYQKGAFIRLSVGNRVYKQSRWTTQTEDIPFQVHLTSLYSNFKLGGDETMNPNERIKRGINVYNADYTPKRLAPKGLPRQILCKLLKELLDDKIITEDQTVLIDTDRSENQKLLEMYENMGFIRRGYYQEDRGDFDSDQEYEKFLNDRGSVMTTTVKKLFDWCKDTNRI